MKDGLIKIACATPALKVADCDYNTDQIIALIGQAHAKGVKIVCFPELCITGYTCGDLFFQKTLLRSAEENLLRLTEETSDLEIISIVGLPFVQNGHIYNCAAVVYKGDILGIVPKVHLPNYSEFYEARHFAAGIPTDYELKVGTHSVPFGINQVFVCDEKAELMFGVEICEDLWVNESPSIKLAQNGASIIFNLSCSDEIIGKAAYRKMLVQAKSGTLLCAYAYADAGIGESTQDMVFAGHNLICENGSVLAESKLFSDGLTIADVDVSRLYSERQRTTTWQSVSLDQGVDYPIIHFSMTLTETPLGRHIAPHPFVPSDKAVLNSRCEEILAIQSVGLATRLKHIGCKTAVVGLSGGLDSTLALIVMRHAFDRLGLDPKGMIAVTMPCFGTTDRTYRNALKLAEAYGATLREIRIEQSVRQHFADIGHDESVHDVTYENGQARERTQILMDIANQCGGIVIGTGDLSELALGWATYNGDHMSMYGVNVSIPKTLVRYLVSYEASHKEGTLHDVLLDILDTPVSPELLPPDKDGRIAQKTEDLVGPYELHDFFLYYHVRLGFTPGKIFRFACKAFEGVYDKRTILKWLRKFYWRFFSQQFKRSCLPDGPKVGSVTLSPRGDWRMPSDASVSVWMREVDELERKILPQESSDSNG